MTKKDLMRLAANEDAMSALMQMRNIQRNMCHKTIYERKTAERNLKELATEIIECLDK